MKVSGVQCCVELITPKFYGMNLHLQFKCIIFKTNKMLKYQPTQVHKSVSYLYNTLTTTKNKCSK